MPSKREISVDSELEQKVKELQYLQDVIRNSTLQVEFHLRKIEEVLANISCAAKDYMETWNQS